MILATIETLICLAEASGTDGVPKTAAVTISIAVFIAASLIAGVCSYKYKIKKYREKAESEKNKNEAKGE